MLDPHQRRLLLDALRPPDGWRLDSAIATTFTLDLITLLTVPLALQMFDAEDEDGKPRMDPVALLEALRQTSDRLMVFCQAGRIGVPASQHRLFAFLESAVVEVKAPRGGVFHPKVWVLRLVSDSEGVGYRVLCGSRNLTGDRSWDLLLALDGRLKDRRVAYAANHPLADFVAALPGLALEKMDNNAAERAARIADELRRVEFELPENFDEVRFWPLGLQKARWPFADGTWRRLVVSPFVSDKTLERLAEEADGSMLVSRPESLAGLAATTLAKFEKVYAMAPTGDAELASDADDVLTGLHAKMVVGDDGKRTSVWIGSANATDAAFEHNVEFTVQLIGSKARAGTQAMLDSIQPLITEFVPMEAGSAEDLPGAAGMNRMHAQLAVWPMRARVDGGDGANALDLISTSSEPMATVPGVTVMAWPVTLAQDTHARPVGLSGVLARFEPLSVESLTPFIAFEIAAEQPGAVPLRFVRALPLDGAPADRRQRILRAVLENREQVMRLLLLLLMDEQSVPGGDLATTGEGSGATWLIGGETLLEALLGALHAAPKRLDRVHSVLTELLATEEGTRLLPDDFLRVWDPIWAARQGVQA